MSELTCKNDNRATIRWKLLTTASAMALLGSAYLPESAQAADAGRPLIWFELGGGLEQLSMPDEQFAPSFVLRTPRPSPETVSPLSVGHAPRYGFSEDARIAFQPEQSDWIFSASIRYGRSSAKQHLRQQSAYSTKPLNEKTVARYPNAFAPFYRQALQFMDTTQKNTESHAIVDFQAGKDLGLGMFGANSTSTLNLGVRFAQFRSTTNSAFKSDPDAHVKYFNAGSFHVPVGGIYHSYQATARVARSFHGVGPSVSWNASVPIAGNEKSGQLALGFGASAAVLFGRQRAKLHHQTTARYHYGRYNAYNPPSIDQVTPPDQQRVRMVTVPNIGGVIGVSFDFADAKINFGYRADFFFNAMDGGIGAHRSEDLGFFGPYASISIGLGD